MSRWFSVVRVLNVIAGVAVLTRVSNYTLRPGETGIIFRKFGKSPEEPVREGTHFLIPWIEEIRVVDMTGRPQTITLQCFLQHLQSVTVTVSILYRPDVTALVGMSKKLGFDYYTEMMKSITFEKVHSVISQSTAGKPELHLWASRLVGLLQLGGPWVGLLKLGRLGKAAVGWAA
ncbi:Prohibitin-1, mitochondrial, partial [Cucurbita argyrosperma subsp. sororia]